MTDFHETLTESEMNGGTVLLHCASSNRVGMVWSIYRGKNHGQPTNDAITDGKSAGLRAAPLEERARGLLGN